VTNPAFLRLDGLRKRFGDVVAVDDVSLDIAQGELFALLGGSGSGKSTVLRMLAGLEQPDAGHILIDGVDVTQMPPYERPVNLMFQSYALFPHLSVAENIAFGLRQQRLPRDRREARVAEMLKLVQLDGLGARRPDQLSGGQRQRVAIARALAREPKILLLDEPLGALDRRLREHTQFELVNVQRRVGTTFVVVTHDQDEALTMATRVAVMDAGRIVQVATPATLYEFPATRLVASFIGDANQFLGRVESVDERSVSVFSPTLGTMLRATSREPVGVGQEVAVAVRPEKIDVSEQPPDGADNALRGQVVQIAYLGDISLYHVRTASGETVRVQETHVERSSDPHYAIGDSLHLVWPAASALVLAK
jgi:putrescine transport system ATP-binding protein